MNEVYTDLENKISPIWHNLADILLYAQDNHLNIELIQGLEDLIEKGYEIKKVEESYY